jgi:hypothetical protein
MKQRDARRELIEVAQDWAIVAALLEDAERSEVGRVVVDIGAGTQDMDRSHQEPRLETWLRLRTNRVVLLVSSSDEIYGRSRARRGYRARFDELEYGPPRSASTRPRARRSTWAGFRFGLRLREPATQSSGSPIMAADRPVPLLRRRRRKRPAKESRCWNGQSRLVSCLDLSARHDRVGDQALAPGPDA